jgi:hypothetical protein
MGVRAAGGNDPAVVYEVRITIQGDSRAWASKYGLAPGADSPAAAAEVALDELWQLHSDPEGWMAQATSGMSADEAEAVADSPMLQVDLKAAQWIGPELKRLHPGRTGPGAWLDRA